MRHIKVATLCRTALVFGCLAGVCAGQTPSQRGEHDSAQKNSVPAEEVRLVRSFAERAVEFKDFTNKLETLEALGSTLWSHDQAFARVILLKCFDLINLEAARASEGGKSSEPPERLEQIRNRFIARVARLDPALAKSLLTPSAKSDSTEEPRDVNAQRSSLYAAMSLIEGAPDKAVEFAEYSLRFGVSRDFIFFLNRLRLKNVKEADTLFLKALYRFRSEPTGDATTLMHLGSYIYTSPSLPPGETGVALTGVGDTALVDLSVPRPNVPAPLTRAFLNVAVDVLLRPVADPEQNKLYYLLSRQLYPRVMEWMPESAPPLAASMSARMQDLPQILKQAESANSPHPEAGESAAANRPDVSPDAPKSEMGYFFEVRDLIQKGDFKKAQASSAKIRNDSVRKQLLNICLFYEAVRKLDEDVFGAEKIADRLVGNQEQAILFLGIAGKYFKNGDGGSGIASLQLALKHIRNQDDSRRPSMLLTAAVALSAADLVGARQIFREALETFKEQEVERLSDAAWSRVITMNGVPLEFSLKVKGLTVGFDETVRSMILRDREEALLVITGLREENVFGPAAVVVARTILK
jgi:hypothetical protein